MSRYVISDIKLPYFASDEEIIFSAKRLLRRSGAYVAEGSLAIFKKSLDARRKDSIVYVSSVIFDGEVNKDFEHRAKFKISEIPDPYAELLFPHGDEKPLYPPLVVGMGPCGLFAALLLARHGMRPRIIDRGGSIAERVVKVDRFTKERILDTETNVQFGAGGAGTFSDGKLVTRIKDPAASYVLKTLAEHGAGESILKNAKPHVGTDVLRDVVDSILEEIESLGGSVIYNCRLSTLTERDGYVTAGTSVGDIPASSVVLALGHSSRDTYDYLLKSGYDISPKPFSVGVRVEHLKEEVDASLYGSHAGDPRLPAGEYAISDTRGERGVYTFCMCPGGYVMASASEEGGVVTNGMSESRRDGRNSNAAMLVSLSPLDFGGDVREAIAFQRKLERDAFLLGGSSYRAPAITVGDFKRRECRTEFGKVMPTYMDGDVTLSPIYEKMPAFLYDGLMRGFSSFERKLSCYRDTSAIMTGFETRSSAPLRINRCGEMTAIGHDRIYPAGEGAGYAGGITSAACDGIHAAEKLIRRFAAIEA